MLHAFFGILASWSVVPDEAVIFSRCTLATSGKSSQPGGAYHPIARHNKGQGIGVAALPHRPGSTGVFLGSGTLHVFLFPRRESALDKKGKEDLPPRFA